MQYLPEKKRTQKTQIIKRSEKVSEFRDYLSSSETVLSLVKYLIALRQAPQLPEDPQQHMIDFFGNERSALWDDMEQMTEENEEITELLPCLNDEIEKLECELKEQKCKTRICDLYKQVDPAVFASMKTIVVKLSGFAKFELDHKVSQTQFVNMVTKLATAKRQAAEASGEAGDATNRTQDSVMEQEQYGIWTGIFKRALVDDECPFKGDLNNEQYNNILNALRAIEQD